MNSLLKIFVSSYLMLGNSYGILLSSEIQTIEEAPINDFGIPEYQRPNSYYIDSCSIGTSDDRARDCAAYCSLAVRTGYGEGYAKGWTNAIPFCLANPYFAFAGSLGMTIFSSSFVACLVDQKEEACHLLFGRNDSMVTEYSKFLAERIFDIRLKLETREAKQRKCIAFIAKQYSRKEIDNDHSRDFISKRVASFLGTGDCSEFDSENFDLSKFMRIALMAHLSTALAGPATKYAFFEENLEKLWEALELLGKKNYRNLSKVVLASRVTALTGYPLFRGEWYHETVMAYTKTLPGQFKTFINRQNRVVKKEETKRKQ